MHIQVEDTSFGVCIGNYTMLDQNNGFQLNNGSKGKKLDQQNHSKLLNDIAESNRNNIFIISFYILCDSLFEYADPYVGRTTALTTTTPMMMMMTTTECKVSLN